VTRAAAGDLQARPKVARIDLILVVIIGLLVQAGWAALVRQPTYMDAYYYTTNGQRLAGGYGFSERIIWQFLDDPAGLPAPSHTYWMPLASMLAAAGYLIRDDFRGAQSLFWLLASLTPLLAYGISWLLTGQRWQAWVAALFTACGGYYAAFMVQPSTFAPFALAGGLAILATGLAPSRRRWWAIAGLAAGLAHLARADGLLLLLVALLIWFVNGLQRRKNEERGRGAWLGELLLLLGGYLLVMGGWFWRNWLVLGRPLPTAGGQSLFLTTYDDLFAYGRHFSLGTLMDWGLKNVLASRMSGLAAAVQTLVAVPGLMFLLPFVIAGLAALYRRPATRALLRPLVFYAAALFASGSLLFTFPGIRGSLFHSSAALWPWFMALAAAGIGAAVDWTARRLPHWQPERAKRLFSAMFIVVALGLSIFVSLYRLAPDVDPEEYRRIGRSLPPSAVVMIGDAPALNYYTGLAAVSVPNESPDVLLQAADRYGVDYLVLNQNRPRPLNDLYLGRQEDPRLRLVDSFDDVRVYEIESQP
jgi:hypothetical protein